MKRLHRKMTPLLKKQLKEQERRLSECGMIAFLGKIVLTTKGTLFSNRNNRCSTPIPIPEIGVNKEGLIIDS